MDELEKYLNREVENDAERLIDIAIVHYQLETIHPFGDGNGRLGRMMVTLMSISAGLFSEPLLYLSPSIEDEKQRYIDLMFDVSAKGAWNKWIEFFFSKVTESCQNTVLLIDRLIEYQDELKQNVGQNVRSANALHLVDMLFEAPAIDITTAAARLDISYHAARNLIQKLIDLQILEELHDFYPRTFIARGILRAAQP